MTDGVLRFLFARQSVQDFLLLGACTDAHYDVAYAAASRGSASLFAPLILCSWSIRMRTSSGWESSFEKATPVDQHFPAQMCVGAMYVIPW